MLVGAGLGLTLVSPFPSESSSAAALSVYAAIWLVVVQWVSAAFGGYLTGRLRSRWVGVRDDEIFFRDTAHGFLTWAVATVIVVMFLGSALSSIVGGTVRTVSQAAATTTAVAADSMPDLSTSYFTDMLLRPADPRTTVPGAVPGGTEAAATELSRILLRSAANGEVSTADRTYVEQLVAARTGLSEADAKARIDAVLKEVDDARVAAQEAADTARKSAAATALLGALSLFVGAFIACVAAALGGRRRDDDVPVVR